MYPSRLDVLALEENTVFHLIVGYKTFDVFKAKQRRDTLLCNQ